MLELVRYIHLNPLRAGLVRGYEELCRHRYCGHGVILGRRKREWQEVEYVLRLFDDRTGVARRMYRHFAPMLMGKTRRYKRRHGEEVNGIGDNGG